GRMSVSGERIGDAALGGVSPVEEHPVAEREGMTGLQRVVAPVAAFLAREGRVAEAVGGHQAIVADVPVHGAAEVPRVVHHPDADRFARHRTRIIAPFGRSAPALLLADPAGAVFAPALPVAVNR